MSTKIDDTSFGSITIDGEQFSHDVLIQLSGKIKKRKKKLSKQIYGTSHTLSLEEAQYIYEDGCKTLIVGTGQHGILALSKEATRFFEQHGCHVILKKTPQAIHAFNETTGRKIGVFHITC
jgi:hypothetical protein